jgi:hypothetical protein
MLKTHEGCALLGLGLVSEICFVIAGVKEMTSQCITCFERTLQRLIAMISIDHLVLDSRSLNSN